MLNIGTVIALIKTLAPAADQATIEAAVQDWLDDHPEATTTVEDGSITEAKLASALAAKIGQIATLSDEIDDIEGDIEGLNGTTKVEETVSVTPTVGAAIGSDGGIVSNSYACWKSFVVAGYDYIISNLSKFTSNYGYAFLASDNTLIKFVHTDETITNAFIEIPSNAYRVRMSWLRSDNISSIKFGNFVQPYTYVEQETTGCVAHKNLFNESSVDKTTRQYIDPSDGTIKANQNQLYVSGKIRVCYTPQTNKLTVSAKNTLASVTGWRFLDKNETVVSYGAFDGTNHITLNIPVSAYAFQITVSGSNSNYQVEYGSTVSAYEPYLTARNVMHIYDTENIQDFYDSMYSVFMKGNTDVYIHEGIYTCSNSFIESLRDNNIRGIPIGNGCRYYFDTRAKIVSHYTGTYANVLGYWSPLDTWNQAGDFEIHNVTIEASKSVYGLHDEADGSSKPYRHIYENCRIVLDNTGKGTTNNRAIGGGLGQDAEIIMRNCYFEATSNEDVDVTYHGNASGDMANFVIDGCYFVHSFGIDGSDDNTSSDTKNVIFCGNCCASDVVRHDIDVHGSTGESWVVRSWGNTIRD